MNSEKLHETIVFSLNDYSDKDELYEVIARQLRLLLDAGYIAVVRNDEPVSGIIAIEFEHDEMFGEWGSNRPIWVTAEEEEQVILAREDNCDVPESEHN